eukprot:748935-Prymnesium_polylepis.3
MMPAVSPASPAAALRTAAKPPASRVWVPSSFPSFSAEGFSGGHTTGDWPLPYTYRETSRGSATCEAT